MFVGYVQKTDSKKRNAQKDASMRKQLHPKGQQLNGKPQLLNLTEQNFERTRMRCRKSSKTGSKVGYNQ